MALYLTTGLHRTYGQLKRLLRVYATQVLDIPKISNAKKRNMFLIDYKNCCSLNVTEILFLFQRE